MSDDIPVEVIAAISDVASAAQQQDAVHAFIKACAVNPGWPWDKKAGPKTDAAIREDVQFDDKCELVRELPAGLTSTLSLTDVQSYVNLIYADLDVILKAAKPEVAGVFKRLQEGRINGLTYFSECSCLIGSIAHERNPTKPDPFGLPAIKAYTWRPIERFFRPIREGHTPNTHYIARLAGRLMSSWMKANP